jgi:hypothetical protein
MSTPTLQQVLLTVPGFGAQINSFNEIIPGVPSTRENLATLFAAFEQEHFVEIGAAPDVRICFRQQNDDDEDVLDDRDGPRIDVSMSVRIDGHLTIVEGNGTFDYDADGFYKAIVWAKGAVRDVVRNGICDCYKRTRPWGLRYVKLTGMPSCLRCLLIAAVR